MIETELLDHLKRQLPALAERIYPQIMPQGCVKPALVYTVVNSSDNQGLEGCVSSENTRVQIDVYASSYLEAKTVKNEVKAALYSFGSIPYAMNSRDGVYEEEVGLFRQIIDFNIRK
ncbi:MAG: DUF3168 domain-containing protein [Sulfurovaceae bacterium]|nr:DUF3168 domain-containing protein [Sulfurovaceae bacterium]